jgi:hypothetical protein
MSGARAVTFVPLKPKEHILACDAIVAWEPSVFGGDGSETRLNIVLNAAENVRGVLRSIEANAAIERPLCSLIHGESIKLKIDTTTLRVWDEHHLPSSAPERWKGKRVHAMIEVRGFWHSRTASGISAVCTDIQFLADKEAPPSSPFTELECERLRQGEGCACAA